VVIIIKDNKFSETKMSVEKKKKKNMRNNSMKIKIEI